MTRSLYEVLDVAPDATPEEIKRAYRRLAKTVHPDLSDESRGRFQEVQSAYAVLSNIEARRQYDLSLEPSAVSWTGGWSRRPYRNTTRASGPEPFRDHQEAGRTAEHMGLILSRAEASLGGEFGVEFPVTSPCSCVRWSASSACFECRGTGVLRRLESVRFRVPAGVSHGHVLVGRLRDGRELTVRVELTRR